MDLSEPGELARLLERHGVRASKSRSQHFLVDRAVLERIVAAAELGPEDDVVEVGPGPGVLTRALAARVRSVTAVELDPRMVAILREVTRDLPNVTVVEADALAVDLFTAGPRPPTRIVANLPYQITSPLLIRFLGDARRPPRIVVLVQAEVAERIAAGAEATAERGWLTVFVQSFAVPTLVMAVPPSAFRPPPRVRSAVLALRTLPTPAFAPLAQEPFLRLVSDAFRHRRKQLVSSLTFEAGATRAAALAALAAAGIAPGRRPEELSVAEWVALGQALGLPAAA